jgi:hypothetical protein
MKMFDMLTNMDAVHCADYYPDCYFSRYDGNNKISRYRKKDNVLVETPFNVNSNTVNYDWQEYKLILDIEE